MVPNIIAMDTFFPSVDFLKYTVYTPYATAETNANKSPQNCQSLLRPCPPINGCFPLSSLSVILTNATPPILQNEGDYVSTYQTPIATTLRKEIFSIPTKTPKTSEKNEDEVEIMVFDETEVRERLKLKARGLLLKEKTTYCNSPRTK